MRVRGAVNPGGGRARILIDPALPVLTLLTALLLAPFSLLRLLRNHLQLHTPLPIPVTPELPVADEVSQHSPPRPSKPTPPLKPAGPACAEPATFRPFPRNHPTLLPAVLLCVLRMPKRARPIKQPPTPVPVVAFHPQGPIPPHSPRTALTTSLRHPPSLNSVGNASMAHRAMPCVS